MEPNTQLLYDQLISNPECANGLTLITLKEKKRAGCFPFINLQLKLHDFYFAMDGDGENGTLCVFINRYLVNQ